MANYSSTVGVQIEAVSSSEIASLKQLANQIDLVVEKLKQLSSATSKVKAINVQLNESTASAGGSITSTFSKTITVIKGVISTLRVLGNSIKTIGKYVSKYFGNSLFTTINKIPFKTMVYYYNLFTHYTQSIKNIIMKAADFGETINLWSNAFKGATEEAKKFQNTLNNVVGLSMNSMMNAQAKFKNMFGSLTGLAEEQQSKMSETVTKMALDYASLYNVDFDSSITKFQAALAGQVRPIRSTSGYDITQQTLQQVLNEAKINRSVSSLSQVEKRLLTIYAIMKQMQSSNAVGDMANTIERLSNQIRILKEQWSELGTYVGGIFSPILSRVIPLVTGLVWAFKELAKMLATFMGFNPFDFGVNDDPFAEEVESTEEINQNLDEMKKKVAGFDELNDITTSSSNSSADSLSGGISSELLDLIGSYNSNLSDIELKAAKIRDIIMKWLGFTKTLNKETQELSWNYNGIAIKDFDKKFAELFNNAFKKINFSSLSRGIATFISTATEIFLNFMQGINFSLISKRMESLIRTTLEQLDMSRIAELFTLKLNIIFDYIGGFISNLDPYFYADKVLEFMGGIIESIKLEDIYDIIKGFLDKSVEFINTILQSDEFDTIVDNIVEFIKVVGTYLINALGNLDWYLIFTAIFRIATSIIGEIVEALPTILEILFEGLLALLTAFFSDDNFIWIGLAIIGGIAAAFFGAPALLAAAIATVVTGIVKYFCELLGIHSPSKVFQEEIGNNIIEGLKNGILGGIESLKNAAKKVVDSILDCFKNIKRDIEKKVNEAIDNAKKIVTDNPVVQGAINVSTNVVNWGKGLFGYATGGFPDEGQLFYANEMSGQPEFVGSLGGKTMVANQNQLFSSLTEAFSQMLSSANVNGSQTINLNVDLDGKTIAKNTISNINKMTKQNGYSPILI